MLKSMYGFDFVLFQLEFADGALARWRSDPFDRWTEEPALSDLFHDLLMDGNTWVAPAKAQLSDAFDWVGLDPSCLHGQTVVFTDDQGPQAHLLAELLRRAVQQFGATGAMVLLFRDQHGQFGHYVVLGEDGRLTVTRLEEDEDAVALMEEASGDALEIARRFV